MVLYQSQVILICYNFDESKILKYVQFIDFPILNNVQQSIHFLMKKKRK